MLYIKIEKRLFLAAGISGSTRESVLVRARSISSLLWPVACCDAWQLAASCSSLCCVVRQIKRLCVFHASPYNPAQLVPIRLSDSGAGKISAEFTVVGRRKPQFRFPKQTTINHQPRHV